MIKQIILALATMFQNHAPEIDAKSFEEYDAVATINQKANDKEDGELVTAIDKPSTITRAGIHKVTHSVTDSDGATKTKTSIVLVNDGNYKVGDNFIIKANDIFVYHLDVDTSIDAIKKSARVEVYDKLTGENQTATEQITVTYDNLQYSSNPGKYELTIGLVNDPSVSIKITAIVTDLGIGQLGESPVITGTKSLTLNLNEIFDPKNDLEVYAYDYEDGDLTPQLEIVRNTVNTSKPGTYNVIYAVTDKRGNTTFHSVSVRVI